ncbi:MAG: hypothetical protein M1826_006829 [Phylliscum demangeonii]|nr:MAG: hypothetical protein M1826_006829 [Phylliscum demangeonii]
MLERITLASDEDEDKDVDIDAHGAATTPLSMSLSNGSRVSRVTITITPRDRGDEDDEDDDNTIAVDAENRHSPASARPHASPPRSACGLGKQLNDRSESLLLATYGLYGGRRIRLHLLSLGDLAACMPHPLAGWPLAGPVADLANGLPLVC